MLGGFISRVKRSNHLGGAEVFRLPFVCFTSFQTVISEYDRTIYSPIALWLQYYEYSFSTCAFADRDSDICFQESIGKMGFIAGWIALFE
jgi:hypothetical protein